MYITFSFKWTQMKLYPKKGYKGWINFHFKLDNYWFSVKFAGNPLIVSEQLYKDAWWEDFHKAYETAKTEPDKLTQEEKDKLQFAIATTEVFLQALSNTTKSPIVVYTNYGEEQAG